MESSAVSLGFKMLRKTKEGEVVPQDFMINVNASVSMLEGLEEGGLRA